LLASCALPAAPVPGHAVLAVSGSGELIAQLRAVAAAMGEKDALGVAHALGEEIEDLGGRLQIRFRPRERAFSRGEVVRRPSGDAANHVALTVDDAHPIAIATLTAALGPPQPLPLDHGTGPSMHYPLSAEASLLVEPASGDTVRRLIVRNDRP
jgi:hypothetical protein